MIVRKLPILESQSSPKIKRASKTRFESSTQTIFLKSYLPKQNRKDSSIKTSSELKRQMQNYIMNQSSDRMNNKKQIIQQQQKFGQEEKTNNEIQELENKYNNQISINEELKLENISLKMKLEEKEQQILYLRFLNNDLTNSIQNSTQTKQYKQLELERQKEYDKMSNLIQNTLDENYQTQNKMKLLQQKHKQLEIFTIELKKQLQCRYCHQEIKNAITVIPCAHNYCQKCIQGYLGQCFVCKDDIPLQATYHNDYMKDFIKIYQTFENILNILSL